LARICFSGGTKPISGLFTYDSKNDETNLRKGLVGASRGTLERVQRAVLSSDPCHISV